MNKQITKPGFVATPGPLILVAPIERWDFYRRVIGDSEYLTLYNPAAARFHTQHPHPEHLQSVFVEEEVLPDVEAALRAGWTEEERGVGIYSVPAGMMIPALALYLDVSPAVAVV